MRIILGLGGNLGEPPRAFAAVLASLGADDARVLTRSALYRSEPVGPPQPRYWNAAVLLESEMPLLVLLGRCQALESAAGRRRDGVRWGPRTLDIDLLVAEEIVHRGPRLTLPHPELTTRAFAAVPAAEVAPEWAHPVVGASLRALAARLSRAGLERLPDSW